MWCVFRNHTYLPWVSTLVPIPASLFDKSKKIFYEKNTRGDLKLTPTVNSLSENQCSRTTPFPSLCRGYTPGRNLDFQKKVQPLPGDFNWYVFCTQTLKSHRKIAKIFLGASSPHTFVKQGLYSFYFVHKDGNIVWKSNQLFGISQLWFGKKVDMNTIWIIKITILQSPKMFARNDTSVLLPLNTPWFFDFFKRIFRKVKGTPWNGISEKRRYHVQDLTKYGSFDKKIKQGPLLWIYKIWIIWKKQAGPCIILFVSQ